jgi:hypothetical protein
LLLCYLLIPERLLTLLALLCILIPGLTILFACEFGRTDETNF